MYLLIILLPLLSATISGLFGRKLGGSGSGQLTSSLVVLTSLLS